MIELPSGMATDISAAATTFFAELSPIVVLVSGILVGSIVVTLLIRVFTR